MISENTRAMIEFVEENSDVPLDEVSEIFGCNARRLLKKYRPDIHASRVQYRRHASNRTLEIIKFFKNNKDAKFYEIDALFKCDSRRLLKRHEPELYKELCKRGAGTRRGGTREVITEDKNLYRKCLKCGRRVLKPYWLCPTCRATNSNQWDGTEWGAMT